MRKTLLFQFQENPNIKLGARQEEDENDQWRAFLKDPTKWLVRPLGLEQVPRIGRMLLPARKLPLEICWAYLQVY